MRFAWLDLLVVTAICLLGLLLWAILESAIGTGFRYHWLQVSFVVMIYVVFAPLVYRGFRIRPPILPRCPQCGDANRRYVLAAKTEDGPFDVIVCTSCNETVQIWYRAPKSARVAKSFPSFQLVWPYSWGRWRRIWVPTREHDASTA